MPDESTATITTHNEEDTELWRVVNDGLGEHNVSAAPLDEVQPLACAAHSPQGKIIGGVIGRTWGTCCEMLQLWVAPPQRRQGIGRQLVEQFHQQAEGRGCRTFYLDTFSFQAPDLYRTLGYEIRLEIRGFSGSIVKYVMMREV